MGFKPRVKIYALDFTGTELDGLVVRTRPITADQFYVIAAAGDAATGNTEFVQILAPHFIECVREWNAEWDDEQAVDVTVEGLLGRFEFGQVRTIIEAWLDVMAGVSAPLDRPSSDGSQSLVESLPMEPLSPNRESSTALS